MKYFIKKTLLKNEITNKRYSFSLLIYSQQKLKKQQILVRINKSGKKLS